MRKWVKKIQNQLTNLNQEKDLNFKLKGGCELKFWDN